MQPREELSASSATRSMLDAAIRLLADDDPKVTAACHARILSYGESARASLAAAAAGGGGLAIRARAVLRLLDLRLWSERFLGVAASPTAEGDGAWLERVWLELAQLDRPGQVDVQHVRAQLDDLGAELRRRTQNQSDARALAEVIADQRLFTGHRRTDFSLEHVHLDLLLDGGRGSSAALSALYLLVGRRAGLRVAAVRLPGRYLVRVHGRRAQLVDPFHGGRALARADCLRLLRLAGYSAAASSLDDVGDQQLLVALLHDLVRVYGYREDLHVIRTLERALELVAGG